MKKLLTFMLAVSAAAPLSAQIQVDTSGAGALVAQALDHPV